MIEQNAPDMEDYTWNASNHQCKTVQLKNLLLMEGQIYHLLYL